MPSFIDDLDAFYLEHRRCGQLEGGVQGECVWMACEPCGAQLAQPILDEPQAETGT
jgi:hypothetical protein